MGIDLQSAVERLRAGEVVAIPTDTVYGLAASLNSPGAIAQIYQMKGRPADKPLPILGGSLEQLTSLSTQPELWLPLARHFWPGPLTLVVPAAPGLPPGVVGQDGTVALRWPGGVLVGQLLSATGPLAVTSANRSGQPPATRWEEISDWPVLRAHEPLQGTPSTIIAWQRGGWRLLRAGSLDVEKIGRFLGQPLLP